MPQVIHTKSTLTRVTAIICAASQLLAIFLPLNSVFADPISATEGFNFSVTVNELPTLQIDMPTNLNMNFTPEYATLTSQVSPVEIKVSTSNETGYELYMTTNQPTLTANFSLSNNDVPTIETLSNTTTGYTENEFKSQTNKWGYTLLSTNLTSSDTAAVGKYLGLKDNSVLGDRPDSGYMILNHYDYEANNNSTTIGFAVNLNAHQPAGTYNTTLNFIAITNTPNPTCPIYSICYNSNGALTTTSNMGVEPITSTTTNNVTTYQDTTLWASNFKNPDGWGFAGWSTTPNVTNNTEYYGPNETIGYSKLSTMANLASEGITLYANWVKSAGNLQGWTCPNDTDMAPGTVTALTDNRDNNTYAVAKLADGKCWMIENLRLGNYKTDGTTPTETLSYQNTNVPQDWEGMVNERDQSNTDSSTNIISGPSNHLTISSTIDNTETYWCKGYTDECINQSRLNSLNTINPETIYSSSGNNYLMGNYYNWYSATAGSGTRNTVNINGTITDISDNLSTTYSICPSNWKLPSGGSSINADNNDFWQLGIGVMGFVPNNNDYYSGEVNSNGLSATKVFRIYPNNFLFSGYQDGASTKEREMRGQYWTSTTASQRAYTLRLTGTHVSPGTRSDYSKYYGFTVRCLASS